VLDTRDKPHDKPSGSGNLWLAAVLGVYILLAIGTLATLRPMCDEAWFSSPALNLITKGNMGTSLLDPTGTWRSVRLPGIRQHTYWIMPLYVLAQSAWYEIAGFGLFSMRALSMLWGIVAIMAWYRIVLLLIRDRAAAILTAGLMGIDFNFLWSAGTGRMDMMALALASAGLAAYLRLRERNLTVAILVSHGLVAFGVFTHPLMAMMFIGLIFLQLYFDARLIRWWHVLVAASPYLACMAGWAVYIAQSPSDFSGQFGSNASDRWAAFYAPLTALKQELTRRYLEAYGFASTSGLASRIKVIALVCYFGGFLACLFTARIRRDRGFRALLILAGIFFLMLPVLDGLKQLFYLLPIISVFCALFSGWLTLQWRERSVPRPLLAAMVGCLVLVQVGVSASRIKQNVYAKSYLPAVNFVKGSAGTSALVMGSAELAFGLGFDSNLVDDFRLGYRSGKRADFIVMDRQRYREWIGHLEQQDPGNYRYIQSMLANDYRVVFDQPLYTVYAVREAGRSHSRF
jgi:4-amino-4-deoxy-L-arabinose transferase-like glycosyltransferase